MINFNKKDSVASAVDSILKKEEVEQIDELSNKTLNSYVNKARNQVRASAGANPNNSHIGTDPKIANRARGAVKADNRLHGFGPVKKEEVEQIDELSKSTLGSYVKKAAKDTAVHGFAIGDSIANKKWKTGAKAGDMADKRIKGIGKATDRLAKEEVETVDEALKGNQHKIDKNKNNKIDAQDFKILRGKKSLKKFKEEHEENSIIDQMINEVLSKDASAGDWIHDFVHSDNPKFAGKSKAKRKEMALGAYYKKQNEEVESVDEALKGDQHKIDKNKNKKIDAEDFKLLRKEDAVQEGWDDMVKSATEKVKSGPKPSGGSGIKQGTRYGGGKQKDEPEKKEVKEAKQPDQDNVPFAPPYNTSSSPANVKDKSGAVHTPMSRVKHIARQAMKKVKSNLGK
jgi:hypothetical protein